MPKRTDIDSILVIGAGPIIIGQACEFDYSGTQACKTLREEGYRVILINSNPATIMTDPETADKTYIEPINASFVEKVIAREKPQALLPTMGGQTALNVALELSREGILQKYGVKLIGANESAIEKAEDRGLFQKTMKEIGLETPRSFTASSLEEAESRLNDIGLPAIIRPSFTLGGWGGGAAHNKEQFVKIATAGLKASPAHTILVEESVLGWKEFEMEVVRDKKDNAIIVCSIENIDPMGIHTGDSITVAPALTLTDKEYQHMRTASINCLRAIGVETGGSNVQFAVNPQTGRQVVIEMNPRVSRSSALASKATGFPIAKVAAKLAVGYTLDEISNDITKTTPASFEPVLDYVVVKVPRFAFEKFPTESGELTTSMQSVGEAMALGRNFPEALQKALCSLETGLCGLNEIETDPAKIRACLDRPLPNRLQYIADACRCAIPLDEIAARTKIDLWFIRQIAELVEVEKEIKKSPPNDSASWQAVKSLGFSDNRLCQLTGQTLDEITTARNAHQVRSVFKRVDSCAAEFQAETAYMYSTYDQECEAKPSNKNKAIILGGGPNRIGQGIEFDYCCCHASFALAEEGVESIMINCNPETVSTDYDISDRLYFEPLSEEHVLAIIQKEQEAGKLLGVILQFGGQTPLKLADALAAAGIPVLGTSPDAIDLAENRERFQQLLHSLNLQQPRNGLAHSLEEAKAHAQEIGYPIMVRPSYVLGGRAMEIIHAEPQLEKYFREVVSTPDMSGNPVLVEAYLRDAIEVDVDALGDGEAALVCGIMEHIEEAGVHSGDSACALPTYSLPPDVIKEIKTQTLALARALKIKGLMNIQFAVLEKEIFVIEVNPRASRTVPFVAKAYGVPLVKMAVRLMLGDNISTLNFPPVPKTFAVKEAVFPFQRFPNMDTLLGPEMRSTGEVMGLAQTFPLAFAKSQIACGLDLPQSGCAFISVKQSDKEKFLPVAQKLYGLGFTLLATDGTATFLRQQGLPVRRINKVLQGSPHIVDIIEQNQIGLMFNTTEGTQSILDSRSLRRAALMAQIPYYTTFSGAHAATEAIAHIKTQKFQILALQDR